LRIVVVGAGGLGAYFAGRWAEAGLDVTLLARGRQLAALADAPLRIRSPLGDLERRIPTSGDAAAIGEVDLVMLATKTWQLAAAARSLSPLLGPRTIVFGIQNGVEAADEIAATVGRERTLAGTCRIISFVESPGVVRHLGVQPVLTFGEPGGGGSERARRALEQLARGGGMTVRLSPAIEIDLWKKFLFFSPVSAVGAVTQAPVGAWRDLSPVRELFAGAMREVFALATARGLELPGDSIEANLAFLDRLPAEGSSSLQRDFRDGRRTELEALAGAVVRLGREHGVATPLHAALYAALLPKELRARGEVSWTDRDDVG